MGLRTKYNRKALAKYILVSTANVNRYEWFEAVPVA
jgi:hypothetical protein